MRYHRGEAGATMTDHVADRLPRVRLVARVWPGHAVIRS